MKNKTFTTALFVFSLAAISFVSMAALNKEVNIENFGIPVTVSVPDGAEVKKGMMGGEIDGVTIFNVEIKKGSFVLDVTMTDEEPEEDLSEAVAFFKETAQENDDFKAIVAEEANGFIYSLEDEGTTVYGFDYVLEKDGRHIEFSEGLYMDDFTMADIKALYAAAKSAH